MNEMKFWDAIKARVKGVFDNIDQELANLISGKAVEIQKTKDKNRKAALYGDLVTKIQDDFKSKLEGSQNILSCRKTVKDSLCEVYAMLAGVGNTIGVPNLVPSKMFIKGSAAFMGKINIKNFDKSIDDNVNRLFEQVFQLTDEQRNFLTRNPIIDNVVDDKTKIDDNMRTLIESWMTKNIFTPITLSGEKSIKGDVVNRLPGVDLKQFTDQMGSKNVKSEEALLRAVTTLKDPRHMAIVRDALVKAGVISSVDAKNMLF